MTHICLIHKENILFKYLFKCFVFLKCIITSLSILYSTHKHIFLWKGLRCDVIAPRFCGLLILRWCFWIEEDHRYPLIQNKHIPLSFTLLCDREQPVRLNTSLALRRVEALIQIKQCQKAGSSTFTFWIISSKISNQFSWSLLQHLYKRCGYNYDNINHINVHQLCCEILTHTFVPIFSWTPCY